MLSYFLVVLIGCLAAAGGLACRYADGKKVSPVQLLVMLGMLGMFCFGFKGWNEWPNLSMQTVLIGLLCGATQYVPIRLLKQALDVGPLSPAWCALSLGEFVPVILFSMLFAGEYPTTSQYFSLAATFITIILASFGLTGKSDKATTWKSRIYYWLLLLLMLFSVGFLNIGLKFSSQYYPGTELVSLLESQQCLIMFFVYVGITSCSVLEMTIAKKWQFSKTFFFCGSVLTFEALVRYILILTLMHLSTTLIFALSNTVSILLASVLSSLLFHEKRTATWYAMLFFAILAILLNH